MLLRHARSLLFLPASNARAAEKARGLPCDMVILDLEDAVADDRKQEARAAVAATLAQGYPGKLTAIRINGTGTKWHGDDMIAARNAKADFIVLPKVESAAQVHAVYTVTARPVIAMIESPAGVLAAPSIAAEHGAAGLFLGTNDLRKELGIPASASRWGIMMALQSVVLAARASGIAVFDGVYNRLDEAGPVENGQLPDDGPGRHIDRRPDQHLPGFGGDELRHLGPGRGDLHRPDRMGHAAHQVGIFLLCRP